ncbi:hypothetical protein BH23CHL2_BH23CHL2_36700 [soil metagenome]
MSAEQNKQRLRDFYANVWHADDPDYDAYLAPEAASYRQEIEEGRAANPGVHFDLGQIIAEGDAVVAVWTTSAIPNVEGISVWHFQDGKITGRTAYNRNLD